MVHDRLSLLNVYSSCPHSGRYFTKQLPVKTVMAPSIHSGTKAKHFFTSSERFWSHCCFTAKANAAACKTELNPADYCCATNSSPPARDRRVSLLVICFKRRDSGVQFHDASGWRKQRCGLACSELTSWPSDIFIKSIRRAQTEQRQRRKLSCPPWLHTVEHIYLIFPSG